MNREHTPNFDVKEADWSYSEIETFCQLRSQKLNNTKSTMEIIESICASFSQSMENDCALFAIDSKTNEWNDIRYTIQFPIEPDLFDQFFNSRKGYRACYFKAADCGDLFNEIIINRIISILRKYDSKYVRAMKVIVEFVGESREESCVGFQNVGVPQICSALFPDFSKIWIAERLYRGEKSEDTGFAYIPHGPRLIVPRWRCAKHPKTGQKGEGERAPLPDREYSWLDVKSSFVSCDGLPSQIKSPADRAMAIHSCGWT